MVVVNTMWIVSGKSVILRFKSNEDLIDDALLLQGIFI